MTRAEQVFWLRFLALLGMTIQSTRKFIKKIYVGAWFPSPFIVGFQALLLLVSKPFYCWMSR
jgi:cbb3-type cytochrome oxidase subunit 1